MGPVLSKAVYVCVLTASSGRFRGLTFTLTVFAFLGLLQIKNNLLWW
jgi:hypothetical protein